MQDEWIKKCFAFALLIIAVSVAYYFVISLPRERNARLEMERQEKAEAKIMLDLCLDEAFQNYRARWDKTCEGLRRAEDCTLPGTTAQDYDRSHDRARDDCFKKYPKR